jgi:hypothetical protein
VADPFLHSDGQSKSMLKKYPSGQGRGGVSLSDRRAGRDFMKQRPELSIDTIETYLHNLYAVQPDFLYSVSRDFIGNCRTPMLVLPDDVPAHPLQTSIDVASLAPNAEITVFPWKEPAELKKRTIDRVRRFLQAHIPMHAAVQ